MKTIKYRFLSCEVNRGSEENPKYEPVFVDKELNCPTEADFAINLSIAQEEAYNGEYTIEDDGQPEPSPVPAGDSVTWAELDAAYQEGVDSV